MENNEIFHHFAAILDNLIDNQDFFKVYFQSCYSLDEDIVVNPTTTLCTGISRGCFVDSDFNYVVKFDIDDTEGCARELDTFAAASEYGVSKFFTQPFYLGIYEKTFNYYHIYDIDDLIEWHDENEFYEMIDSVKDECDKCAITIKLPLYAYPRADSYIFNHYSENDEKIALRSTSPLKGYNLAIAASFIGDYGEDEYYHLTKFLCDYDIGDIHMGNVGAINNHICIIDYAGIGENDYVSEISRYS